MPSWSPHLEFVVTVISDTMVRVGIAGAVMKRITCITRKVPKSYLMEESMPAILMPSVTIGDVVKFF